MNPAIRGEQAGWLDVGAEQGEDTSGVCDGKIPVQKIDKVNFLLA